jgi:hypothetical protein
MKSKTEKIKTGINVPGKLIVMAILVLLMSSGLAVGEPSGKNEKSPSYGDGTPVTVSNPYAGLPDQINTTTKTEIQPNSASPLSFTPEKNNWGQFMKDYSRSGRYLTGYDLFGGTLGDYNTSGAVVHSSSIMLNTNGVDPDLCGIYAGVNTYYCTIAGDDSGKITGIDTNVFGYRMWQVSPSPATPIVSFGASLSTSYSRNFWVTTLGNPTLMVSPVLEYRKTHDGSLQCGVYCTVSFSGSARIKAPLLYLPAGGGGGITEDRVYVIVEYPYASPVYSSVYSFAYSCSMPPCSIIQRWSRSFSGILAGPAGPLALSRSGEARPIIVPFANSLGTIYMLSEVDGHTLTSTNIGTPIKATPTIDISSWGYLYVPGSDGKIRRFNISLAYLFSLEWTSADLTRLYNGQKAASIFSAIANNDDSLYVAIQNGYTDSKGMVQFYRIYKKNGTQVWATPRWEYSRPTTIPEEYASPSITPNYVFFVSLGPGISGCDSGAWFQRNIADGSISHVRRCLNSSIGDYYTPVSTAISATYWAVPPWQNDFCFAVTGSTMYDWGIGSQ